jgi:MerR family copper efflux transcriptional regulator
METRMRIGELAMRAGVSAQTLRYYERRGLLDKNRRTPSGYRDYGAGAIRQVRFIRRAQDLGFTLDEIANLLGLRADAANSCAAARERASATLARIESKIADLLRMRDALARYESACRTCAELEECPLLAELGGERDDDGA